MTAALRITSIAAALAAMTLACGDSRASASATAGTHSSAPGAAARRDTTPPAGADSALAAARAATDRLEQLCASDSALARVRLAAARDSVRRDSLARADSVARVDSLARADSIARHDSLELASAGKHPRRRTRHAGAPHRHVDPAPKPDAWRSVVARRAVRQAPLPGSLLPGCRVVAYYGNPLSKRMGILGEIPPDEMLARLDQQAAAYQRADPGTHVLPALELIATVAQGSAGRDGMYRLRMSDSLIEKVAGWAQRKHYLLILDIQTGHSDVAREIAPLMKYLARPYVHLALDPEFAMPAGKVPGHVIGTLDARDVNVAADSLARLVSEKQLPPKMLIVHRFTQPMLTNQERIRLDPRVQVVIDMDGFGAPWLKRHSYAAYVHDRPVQFTGFKLFYKNDKPILSPEQVLKLYPVPLFIMYQ